MTTLSLEDDLRKACNNLSSLRARKSELESRKLEAESRLKANSHLIETKIDQITIIRAALVISRAETTPTENEAPTPDIEGTGNNPTKNQQTNTSQPEQP